MFRPNVERCVGTLHTVVPLLCSGECCSAPQTESCTFAGQEAITKSLLKRPFSTHVAKLVNLVSDTLKDACTNIRVVVEECKSDRMSLPGHDMLGRSRLPDIPPVQQTDAEGVVKDLDCAFHTIISVCRILYHATRQPRNLSSVDPLALVYDDPVHARLCSTQLKNVLRQTFCFLNLESPFIYE